MQGEKVLVGMSGGVDSSVAALLLKESGYDVSGVTLSLFDKESQININDAATVCNVMGISHYIVDLKEQFSSCVIDNFISEYKCGNTPNPCIVCNKFIKFGAMLEKAHKMGFTKIATGHYARIERTKEGRFLLKKARDTQKDQSYMLYVLNQKQLANIIFPLGELEKTEIRDKAKQAGFINFNRPDSQDICFVPSGDYAAFIEEFGGFVSQNGDYVDVNGNYLGRHKGIIRYTIGQRKGLGIALGKPYFVIDKNYETNRVILGEETHLFKREIIVKDVNFIPFDKLKEKMRVTAKLRYRHNPAYAIIEPLADDSVKVVFDEPQRAASPGQSAVFYDGEIVVGGGLIV